MEKEIIETVLTEILEELKQLKKLSIESTNAIKESSERLSSIEKKLENSQAIKPEVSTQPLERLIFSGLQRINETLEQKPAPVKREFRILLFPPYNEKEFYRIVFGRIIGWLVLLVIAKYLYVLGMTWMERH